MFRLTKAKKDAEVTKCHHPRLLRALGLFVKEMLIACVEDAAEHVPDSPPHRFEARGIALLSIFKGVTLGRAFAAKIFRNRQRRFASAPQGDEPWVSCNAW
jgi:hypothetical protein